MPAGKIGVRNSYPLNFELYCGLDGQPYLLREAKQEVSISITAISMKAEIIFIFICRIFVFINGKLEQLFY
jgi:hypothetical protein